ncbi:MAG: site-specific integrase [Lachnospiraceae bacterium]|nr:site-specific integrase [Lachnospiraceae bacterium]
MINISDVQNSMEAMKREELLKKHPYKIWQGKDDKWYTYLPDKAKGRILKKRTTKKSIEDEVIEYMKSELENPTVKDVFEEWINRKLEMGEVSNPTYERYRIDFERFFHTFGERKVKSVTEEEIEDFLTNCIVRFHLTSKSFCNLKIIVRGIFKRAKKKNYVQFGITELISNMEISRKIFKSVQKSDVMEVFDEEEFEKVEQYLIQNLDLVNLGLLLAFLTGIRVGELAALKWSDFDGCSIKIQRTETRYKNEHGVYVYEIKESPKTEAGIRDVIIPPKCIWIMQKIRMKNPFGVYMFEKDESRIKTYSFRKRLYSICDKTGVARKSPHKIRKTYASILLDNQVSEKFITDLMGHTDIQCTNQFYGRNRKTNEKKAEVLNNIPEFQLSNG